MYFIGPNSFNFININPGLQSIRATPMPEVPRDNRQACEDGCRADPTCLSYQINTNPGDVYCWYQRDQNELDPNRMASQPNVNEYIKITGSPGKYQFQD